MHKKNQSGKKKMPNWEMYILYAMLDLKYLKCQETVLSFILILVCPNASSCMSQLIALPPTCTAYLTWL